MPTVKYYSILKEKTNLDFKIQDCDRDLVYAVG